MSDFGNFKSVQRMRYACVIVQALYDNECCMSSYEDVDYLSDHVRDLITIKSRAIDNISEVIVETLVMHLPHFREF